MKLPKMRENILIQNSKGEVLVYNLKTNLAYCLNETAGKVFNSCDGIQTVNELKLRHGLTDEIIFFALDNLKKENLLAENTEYVSPFAGMNRREVIRKVGLASMIALPLISSLIAPSAAEAASGVTCNACTITFPFNTVQFPVPVDSNTGGFTTTGCVNGCTTCRCTIPGGRSSCTSTCTVN